MTEQTFDGWCIFDPNGKAYPRTFTVMPKQFCIDCFCCEPTSDDWETESRRGYSVRPVRVTVSIRE